MSLFDVGGYTINAKMIEYVSPCDGDPTHDRYSVFFRSGNKMMIYNKRTDLGIQMLRDVFIEKWKQSLECQ